MTSPDTRDQQRRDLRARRRALGAAERMAAALALPQRLRPLPSLSQPGYVAGYWAMDGELSLHALLMGQPPFVYCLPCLREDGSLGFAPWRTGDPLRSNRYGIPEPDLERTSQLEPEQMHCVLVPLVGFDRRGGRLGAGGGYYDRSFAFLNTVPRPASPQLVGIAYGFQQLEDFAPEPWDVALDYVATERELIDCRAAA
ncbi:5-formyltetrahydrofolate cyclo-ligase [uncultured Aquimonas sp.]|uniref:5-formyltetrahydrofolate cyclo-ligase n=1 Tax=uncultured Aquimonas sp. TaxID=385483 RepID=UPI000869BE61|nr:5-formyltetrahydrofolate cyclo-ligase [uncultured Aquimonas sp.]ODU41643.1 MAG: 5-formyltetrahydrofolate cyclo-ligase [Xanthomonadaceae bacterium SCN 69-123]